MPSRRFVTLIFFLAIPAASPQATSSDAAGLPGLPGSVAADCALARDPLRCAAKKKAHDACKGRRAADRRRCLAEQDSPIDCRRADDPVHCEALQTAREACRNKAGAAHRQCLRELLKP